jgi:micrococcal nuclease
MIKETYTRKAHVVHVVDGDTIDVIIDLGFHIAMEERLRLLRVNTPEKFGPTKEAGLAAKDYVESKLMDKDIVIHTEKADSFKRWLAEVWYINEDGEQVNFNDELLANGIAVPYER